MQKKSLPAPFNTFGQDITLEIFRHLDEKSLLEVNKTCNSFYFISNDNRIWNEKLAKKGFQPETVAFLPVVECHPKSFYFFTKHIHPALCQRPWQLWQVAFVAGNQGLIQVDIDTLLVFSGLLGNWAFVNQNRAHHFPDHIFFQAMLQRFQILAEWHINSWHVNTIKKTSHDRKNKPRALASCHFGFDSANIKSMDEISIRNLSDEIKTRIRSHHELHEILDSAIICKTLSKCELAHQFIAEFFAAFKVEYSQLTNQKAYLQASL